MWDTIERAASKWAAAVVWQDRPAHKGEGMREWITQRHAVAYSEGLHEVTLMAEGFHAAGSPWHEAVKEAGEIMMGIWAAEISLRKGEDPA